MSSQVWGEPWGLSHSPSTMASSQSKWDQSLEWFLDTPKGRASFLLIHFMIGVLGFKFKPILFLHHALITLFGLRQIVLRRSHALWLLFVFSSFSVCEVLWRLYAPYFSDKQAHYIPIALGLVLLGRRRFVSSPIIPWIVLLLLTVSSLHITHSFVDIISPVLLRVYLLPYLTLAVTWGLMACWEPCVHFWPRFLVLCTAGALTVGAYAASNFGFFGVHELVSSKSSFLSISAPNQVSAVLGFGGFCALLVPLILELTRVEIWMWFVTAGFLFERTVLTMSRGGLYSVAAALIPVFFYVVFSGKKQHRRMLTGWIVLGLLVATISVLQGGSGVQDRWSNTNTTGRVDNFERELHIAKNTWLTGAGLGGSWFMTVDMTSHTEVTRMLAEHGLFGAFALLLLVVSVWTRLRKSVGWLEITIRSSLFFWCFVTQMHNSIRLSLIMIAFSFAMAKTFNTGPMPGSKALGS